MNRCGKCEMYLFDIGILKEQISTINGKYHQLQRINNALLISLKTCQQNLDWKIKYDIQSIKWYQIEKQMNQDRKIKGLRTNNLQKSREQLSNKKEILQLTSQSENFKFFETFKMYKTPKIVHKSKSVQKMSKFMKNLKKNQTQNKKNCFIGLNNERKTNNYNNKMDEIMGSKLFYTQNRAQNRQKSHKKTIQTYFTQPLYQQDRDYIVSNRASKNIHRQRTFMQILTI